MTPEERKQYTREYAKGYRSEGFGRLSDRRYYLKNLERLRAEARERYERRKFSRKKSESLEI